MLWEDYLASKKIDSSRFKEDEADIWSAWKSLFEQMHPKSFTAQKLYLINPIRRKYPLQDELINDNNTPKKAAMRPKVKLVKPNDVKPKAIIRKPKTD
ncbi:MAG: hypothetical protein AAGF85_17470 [Bacteroidota bacterium]